MFYRFIVLMLLLIASPVIAQDAATCPDTLPSRLVVGELAQVTPGDGNNLRDTPSRSGQRVGSIPGIGIFTVLDGPTCADGFAWWQVDYNGTQGWTVEAVEGEYALEPLGVPVPDAGLTYDDFGVSFTLNSELGVEIIEGEVAEVSPMTGAPRRVYLVFGDSLGVMQVIPTASFNESGYRELLNTLRTVLADPQPGREDEIAERLLFAPAAQVARSRGRAVRFDGGLAYRYVGRIEQNTLPIHQRFDYLAFGLTDDGQYVLTFRLFGLKVLIFPEQPEDYLPFFSLDLDDPEFFPAYDAYMAEKGALIDAAAITDFDPYLELFDLFINSIHIDSDAITAMMQTEATPDS
ncbi:MAG: SH3 domain-containing protein [Anaerolineae bacterium]|nr:SH3 domain-containing protein [Anaerolineae bacterium]